MDNNAEVNEMMMDMVNISACDEIQKYEMNQSAERKQVSAQSTDDATFLEMVKLLFQRREIIERAAENYFEISLSKEGGEWKISKISGLSNVVMDEELIELGDEITCREREEYIDALKEEYALDLEAANLCEEKADK